MTSLVSESSCICRRIVVLEDIPDAAAHLPLRLEELEHDVLRRKTGGPVISEIANLDPDIILLAIGTPRTNAYRLTTELKKRLRKPALIVAVSRSRKEIERGWPKGDFDHRVVWPEDESLLRSIITDGNGIRDANSVYPANRRTTAGRRLLLVEDNALLAEATADYLRLSGLDVRTAGNSKDTLQAVEVFHPEIVLCDLRLPDMSGLDLLRALRLNSHTEGAVLALHSAMSDGDLQDIARAANVQIDLFLSKPLTEEKVQRLLTEFEHKHKKSSQAATA